MDVRGYFPKVWQTREGFKTDCPRCGNKDRTFNWNEQKGVGCCFHSSCQWYYQIGGITEDRLRAFMEGRYEWKVPEVVVEADDIEVALPEEFKLIKKLDDRDRRALFAYLSFRGIPKKIVNRAQLGYCTHGPRWGYIIIPVFEDDEVVYWQARRFKEREPKFYNPACSTKDELLYCISKCKRPNRGIIVESAINALTLESLGATKNVIWALLGKNLSDRHLDKISYHEKHLNEIVVALDGDAYREGVQVADRIKNVNLVPVVRVAKFPLEKDINELGREKAWRIIENAEIYEPSKRMRMMVGV